jgi:hypothetical protein
MTTTTLRVPITNVYGGGDYTAAISIGSEGVTANVIMDTGSSTLAVAQGVYDPAVDANLKPTTLAQDIIYGTGGWTGPVIRTSLTMGPNGQSVSSDTYLALTDEQEPGNFGKADGILGLAYNTLNSAYDLSSYLNKHGINPAATYPWPFPVRNSSAAIQQFGTFLSRMPQEDLPPYFTTLESKGIAKNKFAFYTLRSAPSMRLANIAADPLNNGFFILGGGKRESDLFDGEFVSVDVVDDAWYNTDLLSVQIAGQNPINSKQLPSQYGKTMISNSLVDSGTNTLFLAADVYDAVVSSLNGFNSTFGQQIQEATQQGYIASSSLQLDKWPDITFALKGTNGANVPLTCSPSTYWQVDAPDVDKASFQILNSNGFQSILGLPLLNNYFTIFDRSLDAYGEILFAPIKPAP